MGRGRVHLSKKRDVFALTWSTQWDTETDAKEFEDGALRLFRCWQRRDREAEEDRMFDGKHGARRNGQRVVLGYGIPEAELEGLMDQMLAQPITVRPSAPPLGPVSYSPLPDLPKSRPPYVLNGRFVNERVQVEVPIPEGFKTETKEEGIYITDGKGRVHLWFLISKQQITEESLEEIFENFRSKWSYDQLKEKGQITTPLGPAYHRGWGKETSFTTRQLKLNQQRKQNWNLAQLTVVPICNEQGAILVAANLIDRAMREQVDDWLNSIKPTGEGPRPICSELDP